MNGLAYIKAQACENAVEDVCRCRCDGKLHGARRITGGALAFAALPVDDPHFVPAERHPIEQRQPTLRCPRCERRFKGREVAVESIEIPGERVCEACAKSERKDQGWDRSSPEWRARRRAPKETQAC